jgi:hypothetical protein
LIVKPHSITIAALLQQQKKKPAALAPRDKKVFLFNAI